MPVLLSTSPVELGGTVVGVDCPASVVVVSSSVVLVVVDSVVEVSVVDVVASEGTVESVGPVVGGVASVVESVAGVVVPSSSGGATPELEPEHAARSSEPATSA